MKNTFNLWELCGGKQEAKQRYIQAVISDRVLNLDEQTLRLLYATWENGFNACSNMLFDAIRRDFITLGIRDGSGEVRFLEPVNSGKI